jgi:hypothetical protein
MAPHRLMAHHRLKHVNRSYFRIANKPGSYRLAGFGYLLRRIPPYLNDHEAPRLRLRMHIEISWPQGQLTQNRPLVKWALQSLSGRVALCPSVVAASHSR